MDWNAAFDSGFSDLFTKRNLFLLVSSWLGGLAILCVYGTSPSKFTVEAPTPAELALLRETGTGAFVASRPCVGPGRAAYHVAFDNLRVENGRLGLFQTASHGVAYIDNLRITFFQQPAEPGGRESEALVLGHFFSLFAPRPESGSGSLGLFHDLQGCEPACGGFSIPFDAADVTEVCIRGLDWEVRSACGKTVFRTRCRRARLESGSCEVVLRGPATVTAHATAIDSNCIILDVRNERLVAAGPYALTRDGKREYGSASLRLGVDDLGLRICQTIADSQRGSPPTRKRELPIENPKLAIQHPRRLDRSSIPNSRRPAGAVRAVDDGVAAGRAAMFEGTAASFAHAYRVFDRALTEADGPPHGDNRQLIFLPALMRGALLFANHPDVAELDLIAEAPRPFVIHFSPDPYRAYWPGLFATPEACDAPGKPSLRRSSQANVKSQRASVFPRIGHPEGPGAIIFSARDDNVTYFKECICADFGVHGR